MMTKHTFISLLILTSSLFSMACGPYYPFGDDNRFSLLAPSNFNFNQYSPFFYSAGNFILKKSSEVDNEGKVNSNSATKINLDLWLKRCNNVPTIQDAYEAIYIGNEFSITENTSNSFIKYLFKKKDKEAIAYIKYAKKCSKYNTIIDDPWERNRDVVAPQRSKLIEFALNNINRIDDEELRKRYAFIAIRLAAYNQDGEMIKTIYNKVFSNRVDKNILDYWSMYYFNSLKSDSPLKNYIAAQIFVNAPDKRFMAYHQFNNKIPLSKTLSLAKNNKEKSDIYLLHAIQKPGKALKIIKQIHHVSPKSEGLSFLLLREINKLEDWIYTPYYTNFEPSVTTAENETAYKSYKTSRIRTAKDRKYAKELLNFISSVNLSDVSNPLVWKAAKSYLLYMTHNYKSAIETVSPLIQANKGNKLLINQLEMIKALCLTSQQTKNNPIILDEVKPILLVQSKLNNSKFIFAIARELEFKGNSTDAAILLSTMYANNEWWRNAVFWKTKLRHNTLYADFYDHYFFYLDAHYNVKQLEDLISSIDKFNTKNEFDTWKYQLIKNDVPRLYDLLGTKYLRKNDLKNSLTNFKEVDDSLWSSNYYDYKTYINGNPFYTNMYNEHSITSADTINYNKESIVRTLITYLNKAKDANCDEQDYYYFLVANCYFNMTHHGNSWMMKRYYWSAHDKESKLIDDNDYFNCNLAKKYYLKAKSVSESKKFSALCLRMAGRCESYRIRNESDYNYSENILESNKYYVQIKNRYPNYYDDLISNCTSFENYFAARK